MFTVKYQLLRNRGRTLLLICVAALLLGTMALYLGNIQVSRKTLNELGTNLPVTVKVINRDNSKDDWLSIDQWHYEHLAGAQVHDVRVTARAVGAFGGTEEETEENAGFYGGDTNIISANRIDAVNGLSPDAVTLLEGWELSFLEGQEPVCAVHEDYAAEHGLTLGQEVTLALYVARDTIMSGYIYYPVGNQTLQVVGFYHSAEDDISPPDLVMPVMYLRALSDEAGQVFTYQSMSAVLNDGTKLNEFKADMKQGSDVFLSTLSMGGNLPQDTITGDCLLVEDKAFVETYHKLEQSLGIYQDFLIPFFVLIICLTTLSTFLILRSSRRDMAIASSLGQQKPVVAASHFLGVLLADALGCVIGLPVMIFLAGLPLSIALSICGVFLLCGAVGAALALAFLLRFDAFALLTKTD